MVRVPQPATYFSIYHAQQIELKHACSELAENQDMTAKPKHDLPPLPDAAEQY